MWLEVCRFLTMVCHYLDSFYLVLHVYVDKISTFRKLDLFPSSGIKGEDRNLIFWTPGWTGLRPGPRSIMAKSKKLLLQIRCDLRCFWCHRFSCDWETKWVNTWLRTAWRTQGKVWNKPRKELANCDMVGTRLRKVALCVTLLYYVTWKIK
jgi:hypothetical protein